MTSTFQRRASAVLAFVGAAALPALAFAAPAAGEDIRDIRGPIAIPPWWRWPLAIALAAAAAFVVLLAVRWWRARSARSLSPLERARRALDIAEERARQGRSREWADAVAETLRSALAARLGVGVLPQTTAELAQGAWTKTPPAEGIDSARLLALLGTCDLARFAKASLDAQSLVAETATARELTEYLFAPPPRPAAKAPQLQPEAVTS
jgi:hypothetical protein